MSGSKFSGLETSLIKKYLAASGCQVEISDRNDFSVKIFIDEAKNQDKIIQKNLLKIRIEKENRNYFQNLVFSKTQIRANFYFQGLGLYFFSRVFFSGNFFYILLPDDFFNITENQKTKSQISITIFYKAVSVIPINCQNNEKFPLFEKPVLSAKNLVENDFNSDVKSWIEKILRAAKQNPSGYPEIGNGLFLISVGKYLLDEENSEIESVQGRKKAPAVIYLDENRIVFASKKEDIILSAGEKYEIQIAFPIPGPIKSRKLNLACVVQKIYENADITKFCADAKITEIKEEDKRFLSEKIKF